MWNFLKELFSINHSRIKNHSTKSEVISALEEKVGRGEFLVGKKENPKMGCFFSVELNHYWF